MRPAVGVLAKAHGPAGGRAGFRWVGIRERAALLDGSGTLTSAPGAGGILRVAVPA